MLRGCEHLSHVVKDAFTTWRKKGGRRRHGVQGLPLRPFPLIIIAPRLFEGGACRPRSMGDGGPLQGGCRRRKKGYNRTSQRARNGCRSVSFANTTRSRTQRVGHCTPKMRTSEAREHTYRQQSELPNATERSEGAHNKQPGREYITNTSQKYLKYFSKISQQFAQEGACFKVKPCSIESIVRLRTNKGMEGVGGRVLDRKTILIL